MVVLVLENFLVNRGNRMNKKEAHAIGNLYRSEKVDITKTVLVNLPWLGIPVLTCAYLILCFQALDRVIISEPLLKVCGIILIAYSGLKLIQGYNPQIKIILK